MDEAKSPISTTSCPTGRVLEGRKVTDMFLPERGRLVALRRRSAARYMEAISSGTIRTDVIQRKDLPAFRSRLTLS